MRQLSDWFNSHTLAAYPEERRTDNKGLITDITCQDVSDLADALLAPTHYSPRSRRSHQTITYSRRLRTGRHLRPARFGRNIQHVIGQRVAQSRNHEKGWEHLPGSLANRVVLLVQPPPGMDRVGARAGSLQIIILQDGLEILTAVEDTEHRHRVL